MEDLMGSRSCLVVLTLVAACGGHSPAGAPGGGGPDAGTGAPIDAGMPRPPARAALGFPTGPVLHTGPVRARSRCAISIADERLMRLVGNEPLGGILTVAYLWKARPCSM
jgi:hypothetical protein